MGNKRKGNKVKKICDGITTRPHLKDYVMFEDNWISKHDKILYNEKNESFLVLDFKEYEENTLVMPDIIPHHNGWCLRTFSFVKLDKPVNMGDMFYTYL